MTLEQRRTLRCKAYNVAFKKLREMRPLPWMPCEANYFEDNNLQQVQLLLNQFQYGIAAKDELLDKCIELGWIKIDL